MKFWGITDVGLARKGRANQDTYGIREGTAGSVFALFDGMGGANAGEVASHTACSVFLDAVNACTEEPMDGNRLKMLCSDGLDAANAALLRQAAEDPSKQGMGTTAAAAMVNGGEVLCANVGDSRIYHISGEGIRQVSTDHSLVAEMVRRGEITEVEALHHPNRNVITRALGGDRVIRGDYSHFKAVSGDYLLLCSDGLYTEVSEPEIYYEAYHAGHPELACRSLVQMANDRGGRDNITIILISF